MRTFQLRPTLVDPENASSISADCSQHHLSVEDQVRFEVVSSSGVTQVRVDWHAWRAFVAAIERQVKETERSKNAPF